MKKLIVIIFALIAMNFVYADDIQIIIDSEQVEFTEEYGHPFVDENNRTQVPLRTALEHFGAQVGWIAEKSTATVTVDDTYIEIPIGQSYIMVNGQRKDNDTVSIIKNSRTYLPLRIVFESLGAKVSWQAETRSVIVEKLTYGDAIGNLAYNVEGQDHEGNLISLEALKGKKVLLTYFSTW